MCAMSEVMNQGINQFNLIISEPSKYNLTQETLEFNEILKTAHEYDIATGQAGCELDSKKDILQKLANELGINIVFP